MEFILDCFIQLFILFVNKFEFNMTKRTIKEKVENLEFHNEHLNYKLEEIVKHFSKQFKKIILRRAVSDILKIRNISKNNK